jgi:integrase
MAQTVNQLTATKLQKLKAPGMYPDGAGLYLQVTGEDAKSWLLRYSLRGKAREMGLGSLRKVSLADARRKAAECHKLLDEHVDPIEHRAKVRTSAALANAKTITFKEAADRYIAMRSKGSKNVKHAAQWGTTIATYALPLLGKLPVRDIDVGLVHQVLEPIWNTKPETAGRVRGRIEKILGWAKVNNYREGENPARWRDNLDQLLPKPSEVRKVRHHPALPYAELPTFMEQLRQEEGAAARALEFTILTAARTEEVILAGPAEIDKREKLWTAPAEHMRLKREHLVPLCDRAMQVLDEASKSYLFPSPSHPDKHLSNMAMLMVLDRMGYGHVTVHGFRSTFKDWTRDRTRFENYVSEAALAHASGDKIEAAYARSAVLDKRRKLMEAWAVYCAAPTRRADADVADLDARQTKPENNDLSIVEPIELFTI